MERISYDKSWVSKTILYLMAAAWLVPCALSIVFWKSGIAATLLAILSLLSFCAFCYFAYARYKLSVAGGDLQGRLSDLLIEKIPLNGQGRLLDIGCGSGVLSVEIAVKAPSYQIDAVDYWGGIWGYSKDKCELLAQNRKVADKILFTKASASSLPFAGELFDVVISNMVFHEVADAKNKRDVIKEALRVLKKDGVFAFQDLFKAKKLYGSRDELIAFVRDLEVQELYWEDTSKADFIPPLLRSSMFFGSIAIMWGRK